MSGRPSLEFESASDHPPGHAPGDGRIHHRGYGRPVAQVRRRHGPRGRGRPEAAAGKPAEPPAAAPEEVAKPAPAQPAPSQAPTGSIPLRGGPAALVKHMEESLQIPTATSFRTIRVDVLDERRRQLN